MNGRKVFEDVAAAFRSSKPQAPTNTSGPAITAAWLQWKADVDAVAHAFEVVNSAFDRRRFVENCITAPAPAAANSARRALQYDLRTLQYDLDT